MTRTLPQALQQQAAERGPALALRYKQLGIWQTRRWAQVLEDVRRLAGALQQLGFEARDELLIISQARVEALLLALAAQWLGGRVGLLDPRLDHRPRLALLQPRFALAEDQAAVAQLNAAPQPPRALLYLDGRGLNPPQPGNLRRYDDLLSEASLEPAPPQAEPHNTAFVFYPDTDQTALRLSHGQLLEGARQLVAREALSADEEALAARVFAASGQARYLLAPWLVAGFCLNFPEALETRDTDRRELGPSLVLGTRESYGRLAQWAEERLPLPGSFSHGLYRWALVPGRGALGTWLGHWLIRRPLLDVLGMSRLRVPLLVGPALTEDSAAFFATLGIRPRHWHEPSSLAQPDPNPEPLIRQSA